MASVLRSNNIDISIDDIPCPRIKLRVAVVGAIQPHPLLTLRREPMATANSTGIPMTPIHLHLDNSLGAAFIGFIVAAT